MPEDEEFLRQRLAAEKACNAAAEERVQRLLSSLDNLHLEYSRAVEDRNRLRKVIEGLTYRIGELQEKMKDIESGKTASIEAVAASAADSVLRGARSLDSYALQEAKLDLRLGFTVMGGKVECRSPVDLPPEAVSGISLNLSSLAPTLEQQRLATALTVLDDAVESIQEALAGVESGEARLAMAAVSEWLSQAGTPADRIKSLEAVYAAMMPLLKSTLRDTSLAAEARERISRIRTERIRAGAVERHAEIMRRIRASMPGA